MIEKPKGTPRKKGARGAAVPPRPVAGPARAAAAPRAAALPPHQAAATQPAPKAQERTGASVSPESRRLMVSEAAYYRAQRRGFRPGDSVRDWIEAEAEIDALLLNRR